MLPYATMVPSHLTLETTVGVGLKKNIVMNSNRDKFYMKIVLDLQLCSLNFFHLKSSSGSNTNERVNNTLHWRLKRR
jgi:hypothetical protein